MEGTVLIHHGIKGQKWGIRRYQNEDGTLTEAGKKRYGVDEAGTKYSDEQYKRDRDVYGRAAANRINRKMIRGEQVSGARSKEAERIEGFRKAGRVSGNIGKTVGGIGGAFGGYLLGAKVGKTIVKKFFEKGGSSEGAIAISTLTPVLIGVGASAVGQALGRYGAQSATMLSGGYSPTKYR